MFTEENFESIKKHFENTDPTLAAIFSEIGYLPPPPNRNLFSLVVGAIIGQRISYAKARSIRGKLYTLLGTDNFTPIQILNNSREMLVNIGLDIKRAELILQVAKRGEITTVKQVKKLTELKGIGPWTIQNVLIMYSLNEANHDSEFVDYLLTEDLIIRRAINKLYGSSVDPIKKAKDWSPYCGIVTWYLWKKFT